MVVETSTAYNKQQNSLLLLRTLDSPHIPQCCCYSLDNSLPLSFSAFYFVSDVCVHHPHNYCDASKMSSIYTGSGTAMTADGTEDDDADDVA